LLALLILAGRLAGLDPRRPVSSYNLRTWSSENGLPQNSILCMLQTRDEYLWFGTENGLARFDGASFTVFDGTRYSAIRDNRIMALVEDRFGALWFGTRGGGLNRLRGDRIDHYSVADGLGHNFILSLLEDRAGNLWAGTFSGLTVRERSGKFKTYGPGNGFPDDVILGLLEDRSGDLWIGTYRNGLIRLRNGRFTFFSRGDGLPHHSIRVLYQATDGTLWVGTNGGGLALGDGETFRPFERNRELASPFVYALCEDRDRNLWIGTLGGLQRWSGERLSTLTTGEGLTGDVVRSLWEDVEGNLWIGTNSGGLNRLQDGKFEQITVHNGLVSNNVSTVLEDRRGRIWVGSDGNGLTLWDGGRWRPFDGVQALAAASIYALCEDDRGRLWIGTGSGMHVLEGERLSRITTAHGLSRDVINAIEQTADGTLWVGSSGGGLIRMGDGAIRVLSVDEGLSSAFIQVIHENPPGTLWIGTYGGGVNRLSGDRITVFSTREGLSNDYVFALRRSYMGCLWVGTGAGLNCIHENRVLSFPQRHEGIFKDIIYAILDDGEGYFWLTSNRGIYRVGQENLVRFVAGETGDLDILRFDQSDGLNSNECSGGSYPSTWRTRNGSLLFSTIRGLARIDAGTVNFNRHTPPVTIEAVLRDGRPVSGPTLAAGVRRLEFKYTALSYTAPERVRFRIRLEGVDPDWMEMAAGAQRSATYTTLAPGAYRFRVTACNNDGLWNEKGADFSFYVRPYFHQTAWFFVLLGLGLLGSVLLFMRFRMRTTRKRQRKLRLLVDRRTQELLRTNVDLARANEAKGEILKVAAHDLRNPLQAIMGYSETIRDRPDCPKDVRGYAGMMLATATSMLELIEDILANAFEENHEVVLTREPVDLSQLGRFVADVYRQLAVRKQQKLVARLDRHCVVLGDRQRLRVILENLVGNAIKFSPIGGRIVFTLKKTPALVRIEVCDQGPGLTPEEQQQLFQKFQTLGPTPTAGEPSTGLGLAICKKLVDLHDGTILVKSQPGVGTCFVVELPHSETTL